jgi:alpha-N-arabinofuranosidase
MAASSLVFFAALTGAEAQLANVTVDTTQTVRVVDERVFGINTPFWDSTFTDSTSTASLTQMGIRFMRFGGGSATDEYVWETNTDLVSGDQWAFNINDYAAKAQALNAQSIITVNYGSGTPADAAQYVTYANVTPHQYGLKYWEIGNECYGTWEYDLQPNPHDPTTYATRAVQYIQQMKAADPTVKVGVVVVTGEDTDANGYTATVTNPRTGVAHSGWTPVMLATMKTLGVLPDFLIYHRYEQAPGAESDSVLLQAALTWPSDAANLRQMVTDYVGASGSSIELLVTENNSVYSSPGKQAVNLVNGLYLADSIANVMQTEFNSLVWWDFHNGPTLSTTTSPINLSTSLYGWRIWGDYGVENGTAVNLPPALTAHEPYSPYYAEKIMADFARGGDTVVKTTSSDPLLSAYAVSRLNGTLSILVINKSPTATYSTAFGITGFVPAGGGTVYQYGMTQDTNAQNGSGNTDVSTTAMTGAAAAFSYSFPPYSLTVLQLTGPTSAPVATTQPASQTIASGHTVAFSFPATGGPAPAFQWYLNGTAISGATSSTLVIHGATAANAGTYTCTATNASGSVTSSGATLTVATTANPGRLVNLSCRAQVGTGGNILIAGFVVGGVGTTGSQNLLIRGTGPALAGFGVTGVLPDPKLQVYNGATPPALLYTNTAWAGGADGGASITAADTATGAFALTSTTSLDTALVESLSSGGYTAQVSGVSGDTGDALVEVYDDTPAGTYTAATPRLINLAARVNVGTGGNELIAGFVIKGTSAVTVLIRASGPALAAFGLTGTLSDPVLTLQNPATGAVIESNAAWGGDPAITATAASVGAFTWGSAGSHDSALLITLPPGSYTAAVAGQSNDTGIALVEVYEVQ